MPDDKNISYSPNPEVATWTQHLREHGLIDVVHQRMHDMESKSADELNKAHWDFHQREHEASQTAIDKVEQSVENRFNSVNEFRAQLRDQSLNFMTRNEYTAAHSPLLQRVSDLEGFRSRSEGRGQGSAPYTAILSAVAASVLSSVIVGFLVFAVAKSTP